MENSTARARGLVTPMAPVFIGGCGRSGTTMLGALLGNHPDAVCIPESIFKADAMALLARDGRASDDALRAVLTRSATGNFFDFSALPSTGGAAPPERLRRIYHWFAEENVPAGASPRYVVDHTPHNLEQSSRLRALFPDARFIHIIRDGRAVAASMRKVTWGSNTALAVAHDWVKGIGIGLAAQEALGPLATRVRYEDLLEEPEATLRRLCQFLGWEFHQEMLAGGSYRPAEAYREQHSLVGRPVEKSRGAAWQRELPAREIEAFESYAGPLLECLGYELTHAVPRYPRRHERAIMWAEELGLVLANKVRLGRIRRRSRKGDARAGRGEA